MNSPTSPARTAPRLRAVASALTLAAVASPATGARAQGGDGNGSTPQTVTVTSSDEAAKDEKLLPVSLSLKVETGIGLGTFVQKEEQRQSQVSTAFTANATYPVTDEIAVGIEGALTWYQLMDYGTPYKDHEVLLTDTFLQLAHSKVWSDEDLGLTLSGNFRAYLPTSLASRFQNRFLTIRPGFALSWELGDFTFSGFAAVAKYFVTSTTPSIDCDAFEDPETCREGRGPEVGGGFSSERKGGETFLPSAGVNSFYFLWTLGAGWKIADGLTLEASVATYHLYGIVSRDIDEMSSPNARPGRSQVDRFISGIELGYEATPNLSLGVDLTTDTLFPYGADGKDLVILDFERAPDNITSLTFALTGKL